MNRQGFIGGSDAVRIMDGDLHQLWLEKTGREQPADLTDVFPVQLGIATEEWHVLQVAEELLTNCHEHQHTFKSIDTLGKADPTYHVPLKGTFDATIYSPEDELWGVERKHTNERQTMAKQLERYMPQLQFYLHLTDEIKNLWFSCIFGNARREMVQVKADGNYYLELMPRIRRFWAYVADDKEPPRHVKPANVSIDTVAINKMTARDMTGDNQFASYAHDYIETKAAHKHHEICKKELKQMIAVNEREIYNDNLAIRRAANGSLRFVEQKEAS